MGEINIGAILEALNNKADAGHQVVEFQAPTSSNNYTWYRKYADGWVEQGGSYGGSQNQQITLPVVMADANYNVMLSFSTTSTNTPIYSSFSYKNRSTTSFICINSGSINGCWEAKGIAAN